MKAGKAIPERGAENGHDTDNLSPRKLSVLYEAMENAEIEQAILRVPLFTVLTHSEVSTLVKCLNPIVVNCGDYIYRQVCQPPHLCDTDLPAMNSQPGVKGDDGDTFFVIFSGEVEKVVESPGKPGIVMGQPLTAGQYFGQLGLLNRYQHVRPAPFSRECVQAPSSQCHQCPPCLFPR